jgi:ACS family hexuronate transporter-like MFS transporter
MCFKVRLQWVAIGVFVLSATISFLDRQLLAAVAPALKGEFGLSNLRYGELIAAFSLVTAVVAPLMGLFLDFIGLDVGMCVAVAFWSLAGIATGFSRGFGSLMACRMCLAAGESAANLGAGKAGATYLDAGELGIAGGFGAASLTLGTMAAPLIVAAVVPHHGWRFVFVICGAAGLLWIPLWQFTSRHIPSRNTPLTARRVAMGDLIRDTRLWAVTLTYASVYVMYSLWANWTTIYFVQERHLTLVQANLRYAWFPPAFAILGGFWGGGLAYYWIRKGRAGALARLRSCWFTAPLLLSSALVPLMPTTALAAYAIGASFLCLQSMLANIHVMLVDLFGARRAGFTNSLSTSASYLLQTLVAPVTGIVVDRYGFLPVCLAACCLPIVGLLFLTFSLRGEETAEPVALAAFG